MRGAQYAGWTADGICGPSSCMPGRSSEMLKEDRDEMDDASRVSGLASEDSASDSEFAERQRKFGMMMKPFQI